MGSARSSHQTHGSLANATVARAIFFALFSSSSFLFSPRSPHACEKDYEAVDFPIPYATRQIRHGQNGAIEQVPLCAIASNLIVLSHPLHQKAHVEVKPTTYQEFMKAALDADGKMARDGLNSLSPLPFPGFCLWLLHSHGCRRCAGHGRRQSLIRTPPLLSCSACCIFALSLALTRSAISGEASALLRQSTQVTLVAPRVFCSLGRSLVLSSMCVLAAGVSLFEECAGQWNLNRTHLPLSSLSCMCACVVVLSFSLIIGMAQGLPNLLRELNADLPGVTSPYMYCGILPPPSLTLVSSRALTVTVGHRCFSDIVLLALGGPGSVQHQLPALRPPENMVFAGLPGRAPAGNRGELPLCIRGDEVRAVSATQVFPSLPAAAARQRPECLPNHAADGGVCHHLPVRIPPRLQPWLQRSRGDELCPEELDPIRRLGQGHSSVCVCVCVCGCVCCSLLTCDCCSGGHRQTCYCRADFVNIDMLALIHECRLGAIPSGCLCCTLALMVVMMVVVVTEEEFASEVEMLLKNNAHKPDVIWIQCGKVMTLVSGGKKPPVCTHACVCWGWVVQCEKWRRTYKTKSKKITGRFICTDLLTTCAAPQDTWTGTQQMCMAPPSVIDHQCVCVCVC